jgi:hypothetical protein
MAATDVSPLIQTVFESQNAFIYLDARSGRGDSVLSDLQTFGVRGRSGLLVEPDLGTYELEALMRHEGLSERRGFKGDARTRSNCASWIIHIRAELGNVQSVHVQSGLNVGRELRKQHIFVMRE